MKSSIPRLMLASSWESTDSGFLRSALIGVSIGNPNRFPTHSRKLSVEIPLATPYLVASSRFVVQSASVIVSCNDFPDNAERRLIVFTHANILLISSIHFPSIIFHFVLHGLSAVAISY